MSEEEKTSEEGTDLAVVGDDDGTEAHGEERRMILALRSKADESYWELGVALEQAYENAYYQGWGFDSWVDYVENELDLNIRKAQYLVRLQAWFGKMPANIQTWVRELGWTKARMLMTVVTVENAAEWRNRIAGKTVAQIEQMLKDDKTIEGGGSGGDGDSDLDVAKSKNFKLFPAQMRNVDTALELAKKEAESEKDGNALDLICTEFLSTNAGVGSVKEYLGNVERSTGFKIVAYDVQTEEIVYGAEFLDSIPDEDEDNETVFEVEVPVDPED